MDPVAIVSNNPIESALVALAIAFIKPIANALQRALVRRIDRAWPDNGSHEEKVRKAVDTLSSTIVPVPRAMVEHAVRKQKSTPPPPGSES